MFQVGCEKLLPREMKSRLYPRSDMTGYYACKAKLDLASKSVEFVGV